MARKLLALFAFAVMLAAFGTHGVRASEEEKPVKVDYRFTPPAPKEQSEAQMAEEQLREASQELERQEAAEAEGEDEVFELPGVGAKLTAALIEAGFDDLEKMAAAPLEELVKIDGIGEKTAEKIRDVAGRLMRGEEVEEGE